MADKLDDDNELLFRQVHPNFVVDGQLSSQPFQPSVKDDNKLSVDRSSLTTAADSHSLYTSNGFESVAVYAVNVAEFGAEALPCVSDPLPAAGDLAANPAHALADYSAHKPSKQKTIAKRLKQKAINRGRQHP
ncbi:hypothetical protein [Brevundimonas fluminis]|uniref:hypothetical protein n=1 Tax=Brevundimonas fluminis TaxID=2487274 RepID=UPI000F657233|nr:hypothetical protein [Brevundimonas fluminis]